MSHLFVYGTLRPDASDPLGRRARQRLSAEGGPVGTAHVRGRLYDLGRYPGLWTGPGPARRVTGHVIRLDSPQKTFAWLDQYEGGEYARRRETVALACCDPLECWLYALRRMPEARLLDSGDWLLGRTLGTRQMPGAWTAASPRASSPRHRCRRSRT
jgi:gamma-glutamylcyclotransferase (GGCT)/AIG2-like uncharacterized protein YtfP